MRLVAALLMAAPVAATDAEPTQCIDLSRVSGPEVTRDGTILYHQGRSRTWRAETTGTCLGLNRESRLAVLPFQGRRLCRGDRFQLVEPQSPVPGAICRFAAFVPLDRAAAR